MKHPRNRIAVVSCLGVKDPRKGGSEVHAFNVAAGLARLGYEASYVHSSPPVSAGLMRDVALKLPVRHRLGFTLVSYYFFNLLALNYLLKAKPDVVITSNFNFAANIYGLLRKTPVILVFYQLGYGKIGSRGIIERWSTLEKTARRRLHVFLMYLHNEFPLRAFKFHRIATLSRYAKRVCEALNVRTPPENIVNLGTGVDPCDCQPKAKQYDICCMTRLVPYKKVDVLIEALRILNIRRPGVSAIVVGDGSERSRLETQAAGLPVHFAGWLEGLSKHEALARSRVFCLPSPMEGFGIVFLEAMMHGLPIVYCNEPPMSEELRECGLGFREGDAEDLARILEFLLQNPALSENLSRKGRQLALEEFLWSKVVQRYHELISNLHG